MKRKTNIGGITMEYTLKQIQELYKRIGIKKDTELNIKQSNNHYFSRKNSTKRTLRIVKY